jgi:hypothetical protein
VRVLATFRTPFTTFRGSTYLEYVAAATLVMKSKCEFQFPAAFHLRDQMTIEQRLGTPDSSRSFGSVLFARPLCSRHDDLLVANERLFLQGPLIPQ